MKEISFNELVNFNGASFINKSINHVQATLPASRNYFPEHFLRQ